jgi:hypothetical protein
LEDYRKFPWDVKLEKNGLLAASPISLESKRKSQGKESILMPLKPCMSPGLQKINMHGCDLPFRDKQGNDFRFKNFFRYLNLRVGATLNKPALFRKTALGNQYMAMGIKDHLEDLFRELEV